MQVMIEYLVALVLCYALSRLLFFIFWKRYKGDDKVLEDRTNYFISDYQELMCYCRITVVVGIIPIVNIFVALILIVVNVCVLIWWLTYNIVGFNWIPNKKVKENGK